MDQDDARKIYETASRDSGLLSLFRKHTNIRSPDTDIATAIKNADYLLFKDALKETRDLESVVIKCILYGRWQYLDYMIERGLLSNNVGLIAATKSRSLTLVGFFILRGATNFTEALETYKYTMIDAGGANIISLLLRAGGKADCTEFLKSALLDTPYHSMINAAIDDIFLKNADLNQVLKAAIEKRQPADLERDDICNFLIKNGAKET